jgi:hypothetical protein
VSLAEVNDRETPCRRCRARFRVALPDDWFSSEELASVLKENRLRFMEALCKVTGCTLTDAKGTMLHFTLEAGTCHWCAASIGLDEVLLECPRCRSLNLQFRAGTSTEP